MCCLVLFVSVVLSVCYIYVYQCCEKCSEIECKVTDIQPTLQYLKIVKILQGMLSSRLSSDAFWVFDGIIIHTVSVCIYLSTVTACLCVLHDIMPIRAMIWMMTMSMTQSDMHEIELFLLSFCFMMFRFVY